MKCMTEPIVSTNEFNCILIESRIEDKFYSILSFFSILRADGYSNSFFLVFFFFFQRNNKSEHLYLTKIFEINFFNR